MRCSACHGPAVFERTVFRGTAPTTIRLCAPCGEKTDVMNHLKEIKAAPDHPSKDAAVASLLSAIESAKSEAEARGG